MRFSLMGQSSSVVRRWTKQQDLISSLFSCVRHPLHPAEILEMGKKQMPALSLATVYRHIRRLVDTGQIEVVAFPDGQTLYAAVQSEPQCYFQCRSCTQISTSTMEQETWLALKSRGFANIRYVTVACVVCPSCAGTQSEQKTT
jgi:Fur family transcriptional regulator, ferric uptake regulator